MSNWAGVAALVLSIVEVGLGALYVYVLLPPRVAILARLHNRKDRKLLRLAIQSNQRQDVEGEFRVLIFIERPGCLLDQTSHFAFVGTEATMKTLGASFLEGGQGIELKVGRLRALKTLVLEFSCSASTLRVRGELRGNRRSPLTLVDGRGQDDAWGTFVIPWEAGGEESDSRVFGRRFALGDFDTLVLGAGLTVVTILLALPVVGMPLELLWGAWRAGRWPPYLLVLLFTVGALCALFFWVRMRWPPVAQGCLERWPLKVETRGGQNAKG